MLNIRFQSVSAILLLSSIALAISLAACTRGTESPVQSLPNDVLVALQTQEPVPEGETPQPGAQALNFGVLVADDESGLGIRDDYGETWHVIWPYGYYGLSNGVSVRLMDPADNEIARTGDRVRLGGGEWGSDSWKVSELVEVDSSR